MYREASERKDQVIRSLLMAIKKINLQLKQKIKDENDVIEVLKGVSNENTILKERIVQT